MSDLAGRGPIGQKPQKSKRAPDHMARVARLPCVICGAWPVEVHHVICGRFGQRRAADTDTISLCYEHHRGQSGIHASKQSWVALHGPDTDYLPVVEALLAL